MRINKDLSQVQGSLGMGSKKIPDGTYSAKIINAEIDKAGEIKWLKLTWQIASGEYAKRQIVDKLYLDGPSQPGINFGDRKLKAIAMAVKHPNPTRIEDTSEISGKLCQIILETRDSKPRADGKVFTNQEVVNYDKASNAASTLKAPTEAAAPSTAEPEGDPFTEEDCPF